MIVKERLIKELTFCDIHLNRIESALEKTTHLMPLTPDKLNALTLEELGLLEIITTRFAKLQDALGRKIFPLLLEFLGEDAPEDTLLDRLHKLEKAEVIESADHWMDARELRNRFTHEYPDNPDITLDAFARTLAEIPHLSAILHTIKTLIHSHDTTH